MGLMSRTTDLHSHLKQADRLSRRHSGIRTVTPIKRIAEAQAELAQKRESPFGKLVLGPEAGTPPSAYRSILNL